MLFNNTNWFCDLIQSSGRRNVHDIIYQNARKWENCVLCDIYNIVAYKFGLDVSRQTDWWRMSHVRNNRPTPDMLFPKQPVFHFAPTSIACGVELVHICIESVGRWCTVYILCDDVHVPPKILVQLITAVMNEKTLTHLYHAIMSC